MSVAFFSGFEMGTLGEWPFTNGSVAVSPSIKKTGDYSLRANPTGSGGYVYNIYYDCTQFTFHLFIASSPDNELIIFGNNASANYANLRLTNNRYLKAYNQNTLKATGTTQLNEDTWYRISGGIDVDSANDPFKVYIDDVEELNDDMDGVFSWGTYLAIGAVSSTITTDLYFDNLVITEDSSTDDLGEILVKLAQPNAEGSVQDWSDPTGYADIDDAPGSINDTDYVSDTTKDAVTELVGLESCSEAGLSGTDVIDAVKVCARMNLSKASASGENPQIVAYDNSSEYYSDFTDTYSIESFTWKYYVWKTMPDDSGAWTQARFDAFQAGMRTYAGAKEDLFMSCLMVMIAYHAGVSAIQLSVSDGLKGGDSRSASMIASPSITDGIKGSDLGSGAGTMAALLTDGFKLSDSALYNLVYLLSITDGLKLGDSTLENLLSILAIVDTTKIGDTPGLLANMQVSRTDGVKLGDTTQELLLALLSLTDGIKGGDLPSGNMIAYPQSSDVFKLSDTTLADMLASLAASDGVKLSELATLLASMGVTITEGMKLSDLPIAELGVSIIYLTITDGLVSGDTPQGSMIALPTLSDGIKAGDSPVAALLATLAVIDGIKASDNPLVTMLASLQRADGIKLSDITLSDMVAGLALAEGIKLSDVAEALATMDVAITDSVKLSDVTILELLGAGFYLSVTDGLKAGDTPLANMLSSLQLSDGTKLGDSPLVNMMANLQLADGMKFSDLTLASMLSYLQAADGMKLSDTPLAGLLASLAASDGVKLSDVTLEQISGAIFYLAVTDGLKASDNLVSNMATILVLADALKLSDTIAGRKKYIRYLIEHWYSRQLSDNRTERVWRLKYDKEF